MLVRVLLVLVRAPGPCRCAGGVRDREVAALGMCICKSGRPRAGALLGRILLGDLHRGGEHETGGAAYSCK